MRRRLEGGVRGALLLAAAALLAACTNPVTPGDDHMTAVGARIYDHQTGDLLVETTADNAAWTGGLTLQMGNPRTVRVRFLNPEGGEFTVPDAGTFRLNFFFEPAGVARYDGQGDSGTLVPLAVGQTGGIPYLWHGATGGHPDYRPPTLAVTVTP
jgi:hypothetical protein